MKAILVIDKPKDCFTCELGGSKVCIGGCPLKPMPNKKTIFHEYEFEDLMNLGWNACLEKITGETK